MTKRISNSELRSFKRCRRKWWLEYVRRFQRRRPPVIGAAPLGSRVHHALHAYYLAEGDAGRAAAFLALAEQAAEECELNPDAYDEITKEEELARIMVEGYFDWLEETGADADLEVIGAEVAVESPSPLEEVNLIGKLDLQVRRRSSGELGFLDHKTVGDLKSPLVQLSLDEQFRMYALMQQLNASGGPAPRFQVYSMLKKVKRTATAKPPFYERYEVYINDQELRGFYTRLWGELRDLLATEEALANGADHRAYAYPNPTRDCRWDCPFVSVCPLFDDATSDPEHVLSEHFETGDPYERYADSGIDFSGDVQ